MKQNRITNPLPYNFYLWPVVLLMFVGLVDSIYLTISHYRVYADIEYQSFCAISRAVNCDTVSQSPYAIMLNLPVALWGAIGYSCLSIFVYLAAKNGRKKVRYWSIIFWITLVFSGLSIILALISTYFIGSYCIMCIVTYGVNLALLYYSWLILRRFSNSGLIENTRTDFLFLWANRAKSVLIFAAVIMAVILVWTVYPNYWKFQPPEVVADVPTGFTPSGFPWIGAENPVLEITEFADYQCFQCRKMHFFLRRLMMENPDKIKIIHRHYPMDHEFNPIVKEPFHIGSGKLAVLAAYAASKNKFWQMNDLLFSIARVTPNIRIREIAEQTDLDYKALLRAISNRKVQYRLKKDIAYGLKLGITGTPSFLIDGQVYSGQIPPEILQKYLD